MANVVPSELAPAEEVTYSLANETFELGAGGSYETTNREVLANAEVHPWLAVEYDEDEAPVSRFRPGTVAPEDDVLSAHNSVAFDPEAVEAAAAEAVEQARGGTAVESGLDQGEVVEHGNIAFTLAADETQDAVSDPEPEADTDNTDEERLF